ncbi:MAG TPA: hypothetical protein VFW71_07215 [Actinomycetota bacterium]|nr:hypothetical protein [Actinomycetota bacterium]
MVLAADAKPRQPAGGLQFPDALAHRACALQADQGAKAFQGLLDLK